MQERISKSGPGALVLLHRAQVQRETAKGTWNTGVGEAACHWHENYMAEKPGCGLGSRIKPVWKEEGQTQSRATKRTVWRTAKTRKDSGETKTRALAPFLNC